MDDRMKPLRAAFPGIFLALLMFAATTALATFNYEYGSDEYVTISNGISPDRKLAIAAHGEGDMGYDHFHLYLFDAAGGKKIGPLEEIVEGLDTGAGAYGAKWSKDSSEVTIVYQVDRHAPLKSMTYRLSKGRAIPATKEPIDATDDKLVQFWGACCSNPKPPEKTFGTPKQRNR